MCGQEGLANTVEDENNAKIYLSNETLVEWQRLRSKQDLTSDNAVAVFLLKCNKFLT